MDFLLRIYKEDPNPHCGDAREWFLHDKWLVEGETFVPIRQDKRSRFERIQPGDRLWVALEPRNDPGNFTLSLLGYVDVIRQQEDYINGYLEIWYDGEKCHDLREKQLVVSIIRGDGPFTPPPVEIDG